MNPFTGSRTPLTLSPHGIQDSLVFWIPCRGFRIPGTAVRIPIQNCIPDSLSCIPESKAQRFRIQQQNFLDSEISPQAKISQSPESWFPYIGWILPLGCRPSDQCKAISLLASLIVNRSPLSVKRIPGFVFAFKTNAHHFILCLDYKRLR